jgi:hypothetical protein
MRYYKGVWLKEPGFSTKLYSQEVYFNEGQEETSWKTYSV